MHVKLGVDPRHADQQVRGVVVLPNGTGKDLKVLVIAKARKLTKPQQQALILSALKKLSPRFRKIAGSDSMCVTTPDMMGLVGRIGRLLGPRA